MHTSRKLILPFLGAAAALALLITVASLSRSAHATGTAQAAGTASSEDVPGWITYQGTLADANGNPISGTVTLQFRLYAAETGGAPLWSEPATEVSVVDGRFVVLLGMITPLDHTVFNGPARYIEVSVNGTLLPRQRLTAVPYAHLASAATTALSATHAITTVYATTATYALNAPPREPTAATRIVARSGGDFTSLRDALDSIDNASAENPILVWIAPGIYTETGVIRVKSYVHVQGAGPEVTIIRSQQGGASISGAAAALEMEPHSRLSDLSVINRNSMHNVAIGIWAGSTVTRSTLIENVHVSVNGAGGTGHYALYLHDAEPSVRASRLQAYGAGQGGNGAGSAFNVALASVSPLPGNPPEPRVETSILIGGADSDKTCLDATGTGYGVHATGTRLHIHDSYICGGHRGIAAYTVEGVSVHGSELWTSTTAGAYLFESTGVAFIRVATSLVGHVETNRFLGTGTLACAHSYAPDFAPVEDFQLGVACAR